jgi:uncharacterized membrane protein YkvA (DUF1232 family)
MSDLKENTNTSANLPTGQEDGAVQIPTDKFWLKLKRYAVKAGSEVVLAALKLYYALQDPDTPASAKTVIVGALLYFILPADVIFDWLPGGYVDDLGTLIAALWAVSEHIKPEHVQQAKLRLTQWFSHTS